MTVWKAEGSVLQHLDQDGRDVVNLRSVAGKIADGLVERSEYFLGRPFPMTADHVERAFNPETQADYPQFCGGVSRPPQHLGWMSRAGQWRRRPGGFPGRLAPEIFYPRAGRPPHHLFSVSTWVTAQNGAGASGSACRA